MLRKRNLPACAPIPNIKFDIEAMKQELATIGDKWQNIYDANPGITKLHDQGFLSQIYSTLHEIPLMSMSPENMKKAEDFKIEDIGKSKIERVRNKSAKGDNLPPTANEMLWDYPLDDYRGSYFEEAINANFKAEACRARIHLLEPGKDISPHIDYDPSYGVRVICPISGTEGVTNFFWYNGEKQEYNLPADGSVYFLNTGFKHAVENRGTENRIALVWTLKSQEDIECLALT